MKKYIATLILVLASYGQAFSQTEDVDMIVFIKEVQQWKKTGENMKLIWWIPTMYWEVALKGNPNVTEEAKQDIIRSVENYTIIAALDGKVGALGFSYNELESIKIITDKSMVYKPLNQEELPDETKNLLNILKPTLSNIIGQMGKNMEFYVFPGIDEKGSKILDPTSSSNFSVFYNGESFNWRLPLGSLVPKKKCPTDNELLSGSWKFCPWHGEKLLLVEKE
ncbi:hypothetical protein [uncultured Maribacter sp.]|uniref:hypothetical protein n=1 Tax=uncultured Maribacter sp. TaxID=431308 RepID=UPI00263130F1|nr:hypothetical protein [uncultured Maribacter sp.]